MALIVTGGRDAVSTRVVCQHARIQAPTLYRLFGDKQGLLDAVAEQNFAAYLAEHFPQAPSEDAVADLRRGWDVLVGFGLRHPYLYSLAYGDARPGTTTPTARAGQAVIADLVHRIAASGHLQVTEDHAGRVIATAICGATFQLIARAGEDNDAWHHSIRDHTISWVSTDTLPEVDTGPTMAAVHLRSLLSQVSRLSDHEKALLADWLDRIAKPEQSEPRARLPEPRRTTYGLSSTKAPAKADSDVTAKKTSTHTAAATPESPVNWAASEVMSRRPVRSARRR